MSWQTSLSSFSFSLSRLGADTGATDRNHSWVLAVLTLLLQLPVVTSWSGHRSNGPEPLLGPDSPHSPPPASRCHVLERTQEQRTGTTPGSWQSSLSSFSFSLSRLGADTGATDRNHSWVLAVLTLLLQLPFVTFWSGHRSNGPEPLLGPGSPHSPPSTSRCHFLGTYSTLVATTCPAPRVVGQLQMMGRTSCDQNRQSWKCLRSG